MLTYVQVRDAEGALRLRLLEKTPAAERPALLAGAVERIYQVDEGGSMTEDVAAGRIRRNGRPHNGPSLLGELRRKHPVTPDKGGAP